MTAARKQLWLIWAAFILAATILGQTALAQPTGNGTPGAGAAETPTPDDELAQRRKGAKAHFLSGIELAKQGKWDAALAEFLASRELYPTSVALKNAAISLRQLERYPQALEIYQELLHDFGTKMSPEDKRATEKLIANLRSKVGELDVESDAEDSTVVVDGEQHGTTPLPAPIIVSVGTHTVRVSKDGFETYESQVTVAGKQRKVIKARLKALSRMGTLVVNEAAGRSLDVLVDGAVVGKTPWRGTLAPGTHTVVLRGSGNMGTPPSSATVFHNQTSNLNLKATQLDAELRVEPVPSNARVDIDGVEVGSGIWEGRLESGVHTIEVSSAGFIPHRRDITIKADQREVRRVVLERNLSDPRWSKGFVPHLYVEALGGLAIAPSFGGSADQACSRDECTERSRPLGFLVGARAGFELAQGLGVELFLGYVSLAESMTREVAAVGEQQVIFTATDYADTTSLGGPIAAASSSFRFADTTPITLRLWAGVGRMQATSSNRGTFSGVVVSGAESVTIREELQIPEEEALLWVPFVAPEARIGYAFSKSFSLDLGVAVFLMFPQQFNRVGTTGLSRGDRRATALQDVTLPSGTLVRSGVVTLPDEQAFGTFVAVVPTLGGRFDF